MGDFWAELRAAIRRLTDQGKRIDALERLVKSLQQQLRDAGGR